MAWTIEETTADDPALSSLVVEQEVEVMRRYGVTDPGPGLSGAAPCLLARMDGRPVGCVAVALYAGGPPEIKRMYVDPHARGHGIGRALLGGAEQLAARIGHRLLRLETGTEQPEAVILYESAGWRRIPCYGYFKEDPTTMCFEKDLPSLPG